MRMLGLAAALLIAAPVAAAPADDFRKLLDAHYDFLLRENPEQATALGVRDYDDRLRDMSVEGRERRVTQAKFFLEQLNRIPAETLPPADRVNRAILKRGLEETIEEDRYPQRDMLFTTYYGWHQGFAGMADNLPFRTTADYESYLNRLNGYPALNDAALGITATAVKGGHVLPCSVLTGYEKTIAGVIVEDPAKSRFYEPFLRSRPADASAAQWAELQRQAQHAITNVVNPAYAKHLDFYRTQYLPKCAKADSVSAQKGGPAYYAFRVRQETTTDLTPDQIHRIGLAEVKRIRAEMEKVAKDAGYPSREAFIGELRTDPKYYVTTPDALMKESAIVTKTIDGQMPKFFGRLPRLPYGLRPIPAEIADGTTTAFYGSGSPESGIAGTYYVNTSKLNQRPLWEIPALSLHEAVPGHHHQISLQQELDLPPFRRNFTSFTAFTEGWGLYAESLGTEMGLYDTPAKKMGQLSYQMWRACRLVVDTGIHSKGWDKARAVAFMKDNSALTDANIDAEVNRYISWPGQALGYMIGNIRIRELRAEAEKALGGKFDIRRFHDAVLGQGSVPLDVLEVQVREWIAAEKTR
ncbi:DUF885 domain-containing protein [Allosphingosinicella indica]|uniref:Uncharacterized conserved protein, DUF885 familyt n=1 Tax=Allosphingosinicella indica TaxID=941907 RepID=A0A1X7FZP8_9SPHN|nr:DUF885 domain-containing protein [Allosphingosinicella indica]SMF61559.1 Uncharacterized conserved protein, DUF885 familyt [Allosphingosinicella indica]